MAELLHGTNSIAQEMIRYKFRSIYIYITIREGLVERERSTLD